MNEDRLKEVAFEYSFNEIMQAVSSYMDEIHGILLVTRETPNEDAKLVECSMWPDGHEEMAITCTRRVEGDFFCGYKSTMIEAKKDLMVGIIGGYFRDLLKELEKKTNKKPKKKQCT